MLTSEQSIVEYKAGRAVPDRLTQKTHRHYRAYAERMLRVYRDGAGQQRRALHRQVEAILADEPDCPVRRIQAFCKLLDDASVFEDDPGGGAARLRLDVFSRAAALHPLVRDPDRLFEHEEQKAKARLADELGTPWEQIDQALYADVIAFQRLRAFQGFSDGVPCADVSPARSAGSDEATAFLSRYNVAQLQACLYRAQTMTVTATGDLKSIVRYAKLARLLHEIVRLGPSRYEITFSGPASVLRETRRYGVNFARFLPALLACRGWEMTALLQTPWKSRAKLCVSDRDGFTSHLPAPQEFDSRIEESLARHFGPVQAGWQLLREGEILHEHQTTFIPDFTFRHEDGTEVLLEIVGFWTPEYLARKRDLLRRFRRHRILLVLPASSLRAGAASTDNVLTYKTTLKLAPLLAALESARARPH
jgi:predicted nuclease of restriction endonuclease-like RecB superfamily